MESVDKLREWSKRYDYHWIDPKTGEMITFYPIDGESLPSGKNERFSVNEGEKIEREHQREVNKEVMDMFYMPNNRVALPDDADGVPIDLGDEVYNVDDKPETHFTVEFLTLDEDGWTVMGEMTEKPSHLRHWEAPTVDALLMQFVFDAADTASVTEMAALIDEYTERIREVVAHEEDE